MVEGEEVYLRHCAACHQPNGPGYPASVSVSGWSRVLRSGPIQEHHIDIILIRAERAQSMQAFGQQLESRRNCGGRYL